MSTEIDQDRKRRALNPPGSAGADTTEPRSRLISRIWVATGITFVGGLALTGLALVNTGKPAPYLVYSVACYMAAAVGLGLLGVDRLLAEREKFYQRGQLEGYMRGWHGQLPEVDDPLRRH